MKAQTMTIIGLDRVGASIGLAVKNQLDMTIVGFDDKEAAAQYALEPLQAIDVVESKLSRAAAKADICVITTAASELELTLQVVGEVIQPHTVVIDLSKMKESGLKWAQQYFKQGHYVGAYPILAAKWLDDGRHTTMAATADLYQNSLFAIMAAAETDPQAVETAVNFGRVIGATPYFIDAAEYDSLVKGTEALTGLMAVALFKSLQKSPSWQDMLRMAGTSFSLATQPLVQERDIAYMALDDKVTTLHWLEVFMKELTELRRIIFESDPAVVESFLDEAGMERAKWLLKREDNDWDEKQQQKIEHISMMGQMFGGFISRGEKDKD